MNLPLHLSQKLDLAKAGLSSIIPLPPITPSLDRKDSASLYIQVPTLAHLPGLICPRGAHPPTVLFSPGLPPRLPGLPTLPISPGLVPARMQPTSSSHEGYVSLVP